MIDLIIVMFLTASLTLVALCLASLFFILTKGKKNPDLLVYILGLFTLQISVFTMLVKSPGLLLLTAISLVATWHLNYQTQRREQGAINHR